MTPRTNGHLSLSSTDVLIAMLSSDLRGSWAEEIFTVQRREHVDPTASTPMPAMADGTGDPEDRGR